MTMKSFLFFSSSSFSSLVLWVVLLTSTSRLSCVNAYHGQIHLHVKYVEGGKDKAVNLEGAEVQCWDEDTADYDDRMTHPKKTDKNGRVMLYYKRKKSTWWSPMRGWDIYGWATDPDIYCRIKKPGVISTHHTRTKSNQNQYKVAEFHTVYVYPDRVARGDPGEINGCGPYWMPSWLRKMTDFLSQQEETCNIHDLCYGSCIETMLTCDDEFKAIGYSRCDDMNDSWTGKKACKKMMDSFYHGIRTHGLDAYKKGRNCPDVKGNN